MTDIQLERAVISAMIINHEFCDTGMSMLSEDDFSEGEFKQAFSEIRSLWSQSGKAGLVEFFAAFKGEQLTIPIVTTESQILFFDHDFSTSVKRLIELKKCKDIAINSEIAMKLAMNGELDKALKVGTDTFFAIETESEAPKILTQEDHANQIDEMILNPQKSIRKGFYTKYQGLNNRINGGFSEGDLIILSAPTGHGKTLLSMNLMECFAMDQKIPTLYVNTEMSEDQINARWVTILSNHKAINYKRVITGDLPEAGKKIALEASKKIRESQFCSIKIDDLNIHSLEVVLRRYKAKRGIKIAFVDYVGRMDTQDKKLQEWQVLIQIAKKLKTLAQQLKMTIFMIAQQTDEGYLQGSKAMKNEATVFMILDRPKEVDANMDESKEKRIAKKLSKYRELGADGAIIIQKNRVGAEGRILIKFYEDQLRFEEVG